MKAILIHLSDSHISEMNTAVVSRSAEVAATIRPILQGAEMVFIVWTGDITQAGKTSEFVLAEEFLTSTCKVIAREFDGPVHVVLTPGNHDGEFKPVDLIRQIVIEQLESGAKRPDEPRIIEECVKPMQPYFNFEERLASTGLTYRHPLWKDYKFQIGSKTLRFSSMNASWMTMPGGSNQLIFPIDSFEQVIEDSGTVNILLIHHPLNWYSQTTYHNLRQRVLANYQILMSGHEHQGGVNLVADTHNHCCVMLEAPALDATKNNAFSVTHIDLDAMTLATEVFKWDDNYYAHDAGMPGWDHKQPIAKMGPRKGFHFTEGTKGMLESMEASFLHPTKENLCLSDVFVYPEIQDFDSEEERPKEVSASRLLADDEKNRKVLIYGEEQFGKTSLLKRLCIELQLAGKMPIMIEAADAIGSSEQFRKVLNKRIADFYGEDASGRYSQSPLADKVVLVDDLDSVTNRGDVIARVISNLEEQFGRIIITAGERFEMTIIQFEEAAAALEKYSTYKMMGFGYKLRYQLIRNWYAMTAENNAALQELVFNAEQIITAVLGKGLVPMTAFHTLVLLQTIGFNDKQALANSGMAEYYEYMLRQSLLSVKVRREEIDEMQNFLTLLAWEMYKKRKKDISFEELAGFNTRYAEQYHRLDIEDRVRLLASAKILIKTNGYYTFAYSYIGYFFVARYLARTWSEDKDSENHIKYLCNHLYLKENANIVLFIT